MLCCLDHRNAAFEVDTEETDKILNYNTKEFSKKLEKHAQMAHTPAMSSSYKVTEIHVHAENPSWVRKAS